ncbi:hypothetical protein H4R19_002947 [Coemansia spiralis]|nr:hypothetical protein H4R19_002947 [Coemansia spiralis]
MKLALVVSALTVSSALAGESRPHDEHKRQFGSPGLSGGNAGSQQQSLLPGSVSGGQQQQQQPGGANIAANSSPATSKPAGSGGAQSVPSTLFDNLPSFLGISFPGEFQPTATGTERASATGSPGSINGQSSTSDATHSWPQKLVPVLAIALLAAL